MDTVDVYLPNPDNELTAKVLGTIHAKSALVGTPAREWFDRPGNDDQDIIIDYEGNKYGAANMVTFADRAAHAADRHAQHYPTVARLAVPPSHLIVVGTFYHGWDRVEVNDGISLMHLMKWLDCDSDQLARELLPSRELA